MPDTTASARTGPAFSFGEDSPEDLLSNALCVLRYVTETSPALEAQEEKISGGLSADGAHGLFLVLTGIENTLNKALSLL